MIEQLMIANRGEIAVRIARTAHRMGVRTVGVYSPADRGALHVRNVDLAYRLAGSTPEESYLDAERIIAIAIESGCDAIHPGYGFLAERADVAREVLGAGLHWVGPRPEQIEQLGDKIAAKRAAAEAGVPTQPFHVIEGDELPTDIAFPAIVKAAAGGGGRGMRVVNGPDELANAVSGASREAAAAFGDGTVFIEQYLAEGRHIEVQIVGDRHGNVIHLGERDCSVQRRNQKVIEESPAPSLEPELRDRLCEGAVALARHVGYENAGTVEYMVADDGSVTFLEVNTRLQVEHPVTEMVTGIDLVQLQLEVAAGEPLRFAQDDVAVSGHAIEARIVAESPRQGWVPSLGVISTFDVPTDVRVDSGVSVGSCVTVHYDSLLAKVIAHGDDRQHARAALSRALRNTVVVGVETDLDCLIGVLGHPDVVSGSHRTSLLTTHPELGEFSPVDGDDLIAHLAALVVASTDAARATDGLTGFAAPGWRNLRTQGARDAWISAEDTHEVEAVFGDRTCQLIVGPWPRATEDGTLEEDSRRTFEVAAYRHDARWSVEVGGRMHQIDVRQDPAGTDVWSTTGAAGTRSWTRAPRFVVPDDLVSGAGPVSPLPGTVLELHVEVGDSVTAGQLLAVVEAMKMEHRVVAEGDATIDQILVAVGDRVDAGTRLVELAGPGEDSSATG